jgi:HlyD family secretion protein
MKKNKRYMIGIVGAAVILAAGAIVYRQAKAKGDEKVEAVFTVHSGPLTIHVSESGTIKAREQIIIKNEVEGRTSIIYLIPEGTRVKKGDLLVELDASALNDLKVDQDIRVQNTEALFINAQENLAVVQNQAQSDVDLATLTLSFAEQDLKKYLEGEHPSELKKSDADITLAEEELTRARETLKWSKTLFEEKYISQTELQADQLAETKKSLDLELAKNNRDLLTKFTSLRKVAQLESDVRQAKMAMERITRKAKANVVQAQTDLRAKQAEYDRQQSKLKKIETQISKTKIYAPANGLAIYATSARSGGFHGSTEPLDEGQEVHERQELIYLPTANESKAEVAIHEANMQKIHIGLPAVITVDSLQGQSFRGEVTHIAPLPDAQSVWMNPDLKVFTTEINMDGSNEELRTGMSCQAEIIVETHDDVFYVPIQAVIRVEGVPTVYVREKTGWQPRSIKTGLDNNVMIHVQEGLNEGDVVLLTPPLKAGTESQDKLAEMTKSGRAKAKTDAKAAGDSKGKTTGAGPAAGQTGKDSGRADRNGKGPQDTERQGPPESQKAGGPGQPQNPSEAGSPGGGERRRRSDNLTPEQREERRKRFENMTPEQREEMRKRFENATPQDQQNIMKQSGGADPKDADKSAEKPAGVEAGK